MTCTVPETNSGSQEPEKPQKPEKPQEPWTTDFSFNGLVAKMYEEYTKHHEEAARHLGHTSVQNAPDESAPTQS